MQVKAPWTPEQVDALNAFQQLGYMHEFTCPGSHERAGRVLVATPDGWRCPSCDYAQDWAHDFMADKAKHPPNPLDMIRNRTKSP